MRYMRLEENAMEHPKFIVLSDRAFRLWCEGCSYCQKHLTDGVIPLKAAKGFRYFRPAAFHELLLEHVPGKGPLWHQDADAIRVHDYLDHNEARARVLAERKAGKDRLEKWRATQVAKRDGTQAPVTPLQTPYETASDTPSKRNGTERNNLEKRARAGDGEDPKIVAIASELSEIYPEVYAACREGAVYRTVQKNFDRDWAGYYGAAQTHPDINRLRRLLEIFLTRPLGDKSSPGTPGQFLHMLPECDEVLRRSGWKATA